MSLPDDSFAAPEAPQKCYIFHICFLVKLVDELAVPYPCASVRLPGEIMTRRTLIPLITLLALAGCGATIRGTVQLVDGRDQPITNENPKGTTVNMINTSAAVDKASASASADEKGEFETPKDSIQKGLYKIEASRIGYETQTQTVEVGSFGTKVQIKLRRIDEAKRRSIKGSSTDEDKIINPGEVNIQPPAM